MSGQHISQKLVDLGFIAPFQRDDVWALIDREHEPRKTAQRIYNAVKERGYIEGHEPEQLAARQCLKRIEELSEQAEALLCGDPEHTGKLARMLYALSEAGNLARELFDAKAEVNVAMYARKLFALEAADQVVTLCVEMVATGYDYFAMAEEKAVSDISRGVRSDNA